MVFPDIYKGTGLPPVSSKYLGLGNRNICKKYNTARVSLIVTVVEEIESL